MSLLSHLLRPVPFFFVALAAIASAAGQEPPPAPTLPPAPAGWQYTKEQLAVKPVGLLLQQYSRLIKVNGEGLTLRNPKNGKPPASAAELAEHRKTAAVERAAAWKEIHVLKPEVAAMLLDPETKALATPVIAMYEEAKQLDGLDQQIITLLDSGKSVKSPEVQTVIAKQKAVGTQYTELTLQTLTEMKRVVDGLADAKAAAKANPSPAPAPAKPGTITPAKKSSKDELPPGMTRK
ncbi:hypothetical protein [Haloferula sp. BvORR071]|uniref:hypothetical protein n=1 Tax=Haloferula sp. BvORR071 TaxID=1396141 RepID=UPI0005581159|nr:hypothetical protein [Haloferula sp. BvORR071]